MSLMINMVNIYNMEPNPKKVKKKVKKPVKPAKPKPLDEILQIAERKTRKSNFTVLAEGKMVDPTELDPELQAHFAKAMKQFAMEQQTEHKLISRDMEVLESVISEYLKSFLIIGYDINGEKISITHASNSQEYDSIVEHARGTLLTVLMKAQQNLPGMQ